MELEHERLIALLRKTRIAHVEMPRNGIENGRKTRVVRTPGGICLTAIVPSSLIRALDEGHDAPRVKLEVCSVTTEHELWATLALQRVAGELRVFMPLDDAGVRAFLREGMVGGNLRLALANEDEQLSADIILGINLGDGRELEKLVRKARCLDGSLTRLAQFAAVMASTASQPRIQCDGRPREAVIVVASNRAHAIAAAASVQKGAPQGQ